MNRRKLLQTFGVSAFVPLLPVYHTHANASINSKSGQSNANSRRLILLELAGANDGLNTVVPYRDERYHNLRPTLGLSKNQIITLDNEFAFHKGLADVMPLWENQELAIIHGLGYPQPNRSHFKSIALWETGGDGHNSGRRGWATHDWNTPTQAVKWMHMALC